MNINKRFKTPEKQHGARGCGRMNLAILAEERGFLGKTARGEKTEFAAPFPAYTGGLKGKCFSLKGPNVFLFLRYRGGCRNRSAIVVRGLALACDGRTKRCEDKLHEYTSEP
jgi:hypothetical protein